MSKLLKSALKISKGAAEGLLSGGQINIMRLMAWYGPEGDLTDTAVQARRQFVLTICVLAAYLLVPPDEQVNPSLVHVATQLGVRKNIVSMVLAETLVGLDLAATGQTETFGGSPLVLQLLTCLFTHAAVVIRQVGIDCSSGGKLATPARANASMRDAVSRDVHQGLVRIHE
ncbi:hypothetical protein RHMOL_Rhmol13G0179300 [Rhododendron molle]|uniref:Uncharacterized protein n=1 Tax=Rhododendron molle TaxID=49168 RepID=A0ACC0L7X4_RHOML|nr:hypothetical protein RHMOL_Rhmol13G0179300 [Rhododendron molle]